MKLVILPGLNGTSDFLLEFCEQFESLTTTVIEYPMDAIHYAEITTLVQKQLPETEPFVLLAESFSGPIASSIASSAPKNLKAIVFIASFVSKPRRLSARLAYLLYALPIRSRLGVLVANIFTMGRWVRTEFTLSFQKVISRVPKRTTVGRLQQVLCLETTNLGFTVPSLYLRANQDRLIPSRNASSFPNVEFLDGPHFILQARPKSSARIVLNFISLFATRKQQFSGCACRHVG